MNQICKPVPAGTFEDQRPIYRAEDIMRDGNEVAITLGDQVYRLRVTRAGKLILTK
ncbi:hemin uptake protein HemP [Mesobacterium pallidum]|uniref:hemin uptake protein HemP n=1 Tax=Mesobacterium pallidum TaxID=2872037 RepID=UPI001EE1D92A|nr:hemin uptake protein HemP [Mesobacterium pallidum]